MCLLILRLSTYTWQNSDDQNIKHSKVFPCAQFALYNGVDFYIFWFVSKSEAHLQSVQHAESPYGGMAINLMSLELRSLESSHGVTARFCSTKAFFTVHKFQSHGQQTKVAWNKKFERVWIYESHLNRSWFGSAEDCLRNVMFWGGG